MSWLYKNILKIGAITGVIVLFFSFLVFSVNASTVTNIFDQSTSIESSVSANHNFNITVASPVNEGDTLTIDFPADFDTSLITEDDIDVMDDGVDLTTFSDCTGTEQASASMISDKLTITICTGDGGAILAGSVVKIEIGTNASASGTGINKIVNPATAKTYFLTLGGTFGDTGYVPVPIVGDGAGNVSATIPASTTTTTTTTTTTSNSVTLTYPNGGESFAKDTVETITWSTAGSVSYVNIYYSVDGGISYSLIVTNFANTGSYDWTVPDVNTSNAIIRLESTDLISLINTDLSDAEFTIVGTIPPGVTVSSPNGGESIVAGTEETISWNFEGVVDFVDLYYSIDGGSTYILIQSDVTNLGTFVWMVPDSATDNALIRVDGTDGINILSTDSSDNVFSIISATISTVTVVFPDGGQSLNAGSIESISWTNTIDIDGVNIYYSTDNGSTYIQLVSNLSNTGSYDWTVPNVDTVNARIKVEGLVAGVLTASDESDARFTILPDVTEPIEVIPPEIPVVIPPVPPPTPIVPSQETPTVEKPIISERDFSTQLAIVEGAIILDPSGKSFNVFPKSNTEVILTFDNESEITEVSADYNGTIIPVKLLEGNKYSATLNVGKADEKLNVNVRYQDGTEGNKEYKIKSKLFGKVYELINEEIKPVENAVVIVYKMNGKDREQWDASSFSQVNPVTTGVSGAIGWYVPNGIYVVTAGKSGYEDAEKMVYVSNNILNVSVELVKIKEEIVPVEVTTEQKTTEARPSVSDNPVQKVVKRVEEIRMIPEVKTAVSIVKPVLVASVVTSTTTLVTAFSLLPFLQYLFTAPILFFARRKRRDFGVVYNAFTKVPVDLAIVRLYTVAGKLVKTMVTDQEGRYFFKVNEGEYIIKVIKLGFNFPSEVMKGIRVDGKMTDIYTGEKISVNEKAVIISANIPIEPKQKPKKLGLGKMKLMRFLRVLQKIVGFSGVIVALVVVILEPSVFTGVMFGVQILILLAILYLIRIKHKKDWGVVYESGKSKGIKNAIVRLYEPKYNKLIESTITDGAGRYAFLAGQNKYYVTFEKSGFQKYELRPIDYTDKKEPAFISVDVPLTKVI